MNAIEEIERQLCDSVAARKPGSTSSSADVHSRRTAGSGARRRPMQVGALAMAMAGVFLVLGLTASGPTSGPAPAAAAVLERLARIAASGPSLLPGPGQYLYVDSMSNYPSIAVAGGHTKACISYAVDHRQVWIAAKGSGLLRETTGPSTYTSPSDRALCLSMTRKASSGGGTSNLWFAAHCFERGPTNNMQALSTNPHTLLGQMRRIDGGPSGLGSRLVDPSDTHHRSRSPRQVRMAPATPIASAEEQ